MNEYKKRPAPSAHEAIITVDKDILRLVVRRCHLLERLRSPKEGLDPQVEKNLRTAWEKNATRVSRDPRLTRQMFSLMQEIQSMPRPNPEEGERTAFNLAPQRSPVNITMAAPVASRRARFYLTLAAVSGSACHISPSLSGDAEIEFIKMFNQAGTSLAWDDDGTLRAREGGGLTLADKVIYVGDDALNFYLLLGQYVGKVSRAKFTGDSNLKLADFSHLRHFLPQMLVRFTNAVPKSDGLPVRIECSGLLPERLVIPADLPADAIIGLLMGAPFWDVDIAFDISAHPEATRIEEETLGILEDCGVDVHAHAHCVRFTPANIKTPLRPALGMDTRLAAYLLALPAAAGGRVRLTGYWPDCAMAQDLGALLTQGGVSLAQTPEHITATRGNTRGNGQDSREAAPLAASTLPEHFAPLALALAAIPALMGGKSMMPLLPIHVDTLLVDSFLQHLGLHTTEEGTLQAIPTEENTNSTEAIWTAPTPEWAMALALMAFARPHQKLANPGIMTSLYPDFWKLYNTLPCPDVKKPKAEPMYEKPVRRRIIAADATRTDAGNSAY